MRRQWWETITEKQEKLRLKVASPKQGKSKESTKRKPYQFGVKEYLASFIVGESRVHEGPLVWDSLRSVASKMKSQFGVQFAFSTIKGIHYITRLK